MEKIKELRKEKEIYQKELANKLNKSITCICDWERGRTEPNIQDLKALADIFGCSIDYLVGRENEDGIVYVTGEKLTNSEKKLIATIRQLQNADKDVVYKIADSLLQNSKNKNNL